MQVKGVGGSGTLSGVAHLTRVLAATSAPFLFRVESTAWGYGYYGDLGNGTFYTTGNEGSATGVQVKGVGGSGTLSGVASLPTRGDGYCSVLDSGGVDCSGRGYYGDLGNSTFYTTGNEGSAAPVVQVKGVGGESGR